MMLAAGHRVNTRIQRGKPRLSLFFFTLSPDMCRAFVLLHLQAALPLHKGSFSRDVAS